MSEASRKRAKEFLTLSGQFQLGGLVTEASHPITRNLSDTAKKDISAALQLLFAVDEDVVGKFREFVASGRAHEISASVLRALENGGKIFFTGCGSTGRLSIQLVSIWRDFWQRQRARHLTCSPSFEDYEHRAVSVMAGGDFALIKAVEGFEDFAEFGRKQITDAGISAKDVVFAITEGGETSFVIGTAWKALEAGARVYFVHNNPDHVLAGVRRSRELLDEPRIEKLNLTTGPMAITGSTRMQATTIQLCVLLTILEMALRDLMGTLEPDGAGVLSSIEVPAQFLEGLTEMLSGLRSQAVLTQLTALVSLEETAYRTGCFNNYFAGHFAIDVLTDTTERSPTYCTPPFRKFDDLTAAESWAFLFVPPETTPQAWEHILKRPPCCLDWSLEETRSLAGNEKWQRTFEIVRKITCSELMRFKVGLEGLKYRQSRRGDTAIAIISAEEKHALVSPAGFFRTQLQFSRKAGAGIGLVCVGSDESLREINRFIDGWHDSCAAVMVPTPRTDFLLDGVTRVGLKMLLNALSTCTMVRLGRVMGNCMVWVVTSNLKLIDRATRYIQQLAGLDYRAANLLLFEVIEYIEPRMKADQAYPPAVALAVLRAKHGLGNEDAEKRFRAEYF